MMRLWGHLQQDWLVLHANWIIGGFDYVALHVIWRESRRIDWMALHLIQGQGERIVDRLLVQVIQGDGGRIDWIYQTF